MHNAGLKALGLNYIYLPFHVLPQDLESAVCGARSLGIRGLNVTIPHKQNIIPYLDEIDPIAEMIGAVNTVKFDIDKTIGYNTDGY
jgi:shikimate dehydrogenase